MMEPVKRRTFLQETLGATAALSALSYTRAGDRPNEKLRLAVLGIKGRGMGSDGTWLSMAITQAVMGICAMFLFKLGRWKTARV